MADLPVAKCAVARYSHGGAMLAAVGRSNAIVVYPAYYGGGAGASGGSPPTGGSNSHYAQRSASGSRGPGVSAAAAAAAAGIGTDGACVMRPLCVLKAHVSTVTDLAFSGDDRRLVSSGAGGAVYFWDLSTGSRLIELEYVDKQCVYYTGGPRCSGCNGGSSTGWALCSVLSSSSNGIFVCVSPMTDFRQPW